MLDFPFEAISGSCLRARRPGSLRTTLVWVATALFAPAFAGPDMPSSVHQPDRGFLEAATEADPGRHRAEGESPLTAAIHARDMDTVKTLLGGGADPGHTNRFGESLLHLGAEGNRDILASLLDAGADPNARDAGGVTPLMLAAAAGREANVELLRAAGARIDMKDYQGSSVADWAAREGHTELARRLEEALSKAAGAERTTAAAGSGLDFAEDAFVDVKFPAWFKTSFLDLREDLDEALDADKQGIMLFISSSRCSYCKAFMDASLEDHDIRSRLQASFDVIGLDIFDDRELTALDGREERVKTFVTSQGASYTPTLLFFGAGGQRLLRIVGYLPPERFRQVLGYLETKAYQRQPLRDYLDASAETAPLKGTPMIADPLFDKPPYMLDRSILPAQRPLLVLFERPGCDACTRFHRRVLGDKAIRRLIGKYEAVQLDASDTLGRIVTPGGDKTSPAAWYAELGLSYHPAILFFDEQGNEVMRLDSETLRFRMEGSLQLVLERAYEQDAQLQRWRRAKAIESFQRRSSR
jgi:thioredoxin-related protein